MDKKNVLELFGGCGGLGYGFHKHKFTNVIVGDITQNDIKKNIYSHFKNKECHILIGGPPCVAYSLSGKRDPRDPRGQLFKDYIEIVKKLKPEICVMENVKGILKGGRTL